MNYPDDPVLQWASNSTGELDASNATSLDVRALETFLVMPVSAAGKAVGESVVEVIDEAITTAVIVVLVLVVLSVVGGAALVVLLVRRRRLAARRGADAREDEAELEMAEMGLVAAATATAESTLQAGYGAGCEKDHAPSRNLESGMRE